MADRRAARRARPQAKGACSAARSVRIQGAAGVLGETMKICRFGKNQLGLVDLEAGVVRDVSAALKVLPAVRYPVPRGDLLVANLPKIRAAAAKLAKRAKIIQLSRVKFLAPVANPGKIIGAPINYADHIAEAKADSGIAHGRDFQNTEIARWGMFLKAGSALVGPSEGVAIRKPFTTMDNRNDHEIELVAVIGRKGTRIKREDALKHVAAYSIGLDMTLRGPQFAGFRKSIDTYAVLGPWMVTADEFGDPADVALNLSVNGELRQKSSTRYFIYDVPRLIEFASSFYTLEPGDLIYTGTPAGVGPVKSGDIIAAEIDRIGRMTVNVRDA
jgi:2-keto-4-pentenoate hydratase/2-oxohepta-3-ene-1,7-dioic acid hydratase in catechol pathway